MYRLFFAYLHTHYNLAQRIRTLIHIGQISIILISNYENTYHIIVLYRKNNYEYHLSYSKAGHVINPIFSIAFVKSSFSRVISQI